MGLGLLAAGLAVAIPGASAAGASAAIPSCRAQRWLASWTASPSDATPPLTAAQQMNLTAVVTSRFDTSGDPKAPIVDQTVRDMISPHWGGKLVRLHLSNRFGTKPVTFTRVVVARAGAIGRAGPTASVIAGTSVRVTFAGRSSVTAKPGRDVTSDRVAFRVAPFERVAVSIYLAGREGMPTEHYEARQTSFLTAPGSGDHTRDPGSAAFTEKTTSRYYIDELDVQANSSVGAVVAIGDSITDGYQGQGSLGFPETKRGLDLNGRWPDDLQRRLLAAHRPLSVLNAGIGGNRILLGGARGAGTAQWGPSALSRLRGDAIDLPGVTDAIVLEGTNDLGIAPDATAEQVIQGLHEIVDRLHVAGLRVLLGTITPNPGHGSTLARQQINAWIRTSHVADRVIDFDAAVRDPSNPNQILPAYDGGDHLHFNPAGYQAMATAIPLNKLRNQQCTQLFPHVTG